MKRIGVFCGSNAGGSPEYLQAASAMGQLLAEKRLGLVYGGASVGLMGKIADSVLQAGGEVIGVIPESLLEKEIAHKGLTELRVVQTMHKRKAVMHELSDGFVSLPGGYGTLDETFEILTWSQLGLHKKPVGFLNVRGYFDGLLAFLDRAVAENFIRPEHRALVLHAGTPAELFDRMVHYQPPKLIQKWISESTKF